MRLLTSFSVVIGAGVVAAACTDPTAVPSRLSPPSATLTKSANRALTYPNSRKYRDAGFHPATASAGSATISTRSLLGRSGTTDVEVTTGTFDGATATGTLSSVQVKGYDPNGGQLFTSSNNGLSGSTASFQYSNLVRGSGVQVKANVRAATGKTDVVTVSDVVHLRPDLVALRIDGPANALIGAPVNFTAFIMESNGDVGARASCVLYADGTAVDRADGIWVDAGRVVSCAMSHIFTTTGTHALEMRVENVRPGDFDDGNNTTTGSIQVVDPPAFRGLQFSANSIVDNSWFRNISTLTTLDGVVQTWDQTISSQGPSQSAMILGLIDRKLAFPVTMHGEFATNGTTVNTLDQVIATSVLAYWYPPEWEAYCGTYFDGTTDLYICTFDGGPLADLTTIQYDHSGADVRYHTESYVTYWDPTCANNLCESYIVNDYSDVRPMVTFGPDFQGRLSIQGAVDAFPTVGMATFPLLPFSYDYDYTDPGCSTTPVSMSCTERHLHGAGVVGSIVLGDWP